MRNRATTPLSKARVRQSWSKYNLYNLSRLSLPRSQYLTFYQHKFKSKSATRDYHGEHIREGQWQRMFKRGLRAVIPMNPAYLAANDGSVESAGRGSGLAERAVKSGSAKQPTPYMQMTYSPLERRLDTAVFRAMFASSARQARQFVVHGAVKVNGQKMRYPGYLLNPGDMFQVDTERVMYATGQPKANAAAKEDTEAAAEEAQKEEAQPKPEPEFEEVDIEREPREILKDLLSQSKSIIVSQRDSIGAKRKQDLRAFSSAIKRMLSRSKSSTILTESLEAQFLEIQNQLKISRENKKSGRTSLPSEQKGQAVVEEEKSEAEEGVKETAEEEVQKTADDSTFISDADYAQLYAALTQMQENPVDDTKPYATPWSPRDYMSAFAFIPRYLEVNQNICAAVYLRHPVARPGLAEVPTPFDLNTNTSAFVWYLKRR